MRIITRAEWGARPPVRTYTIDIPTQEHWLHHAAGSVLPGDDTISDADLLRIRAIQDYHMDVRGWSDIAYSFLMDPDGNVFEGRGIGIAGGHTKSRNTISHALCVMGNYETQPIDSDLIPRIVAFAQWLHDEGATPLLFTGGHRDAPNAATSCPGRNLYAVLPEINERIGDTMPLTPEDLEAIRQVVHATVESLLGGGRILMPKVDEGERDRFGNIGIVNSVWHAQGTEGHKLYKELLAVPETTADVLAARLAEE